MRIVVKRYRQTETERQTERKRETDREEREADTQREAETDRVRGWKVGVSAAVTVPFSLCVEFLHCCKTECVENPLK